METFEGNLDHFNPNNPHAGDEKLPVQYYMGLIKDEDESERAGRPIYKDVECIRIFNSKDNIIDRPVRDTDKARWPRAYAVWKQSGASTPGATGTRLEHWPQLSRAQAEEFKYFKIFTVEQLAEIPDSVAHNFMGIQKYKALARAYVEAAKGEVPLLKMRAELEKRDGVIAELVAEVKRLGVILRKAPTKEKELA